MFNVAVDNKFCDSDLVKLLMSDLVEDERVREPALIIQSKTKRVVQFELCNGATIQMPCRMPEDWESKYKSQKEWDRPDK